MAETPSETMAQEGPLLAWVGKQPDAIEGVRSVLERRPPEWKRPAGGDLPGCPSEVGGEDGREGEEKEGRKEEE